MKRFICSQCGSLVNLEETNDVQIRFCKYCGSRLPDYSVVDIKSTDNDFMIEHYVRAVENEMYGNTETAIESYIKILKVNPDFAPAQRGLVRLYDESEDDTISTYFSGLKNNVTISFESEKKYCLKVRFENRKDLVLFPGETKGVYIDPVYQRIGFSLGIRDYYCNIGFVDDNSSYNITYLFDGRNHIRIIDDRGNDFSDSVY